MLAGELEIYTFLPDCLQREYRRTRDRMSVNEFLHWLAKARYIEQLQETITANAIIRAFGEEE